MVSKASYSFSVSAGVNELLTISTFNELGVSYWSEMRFMHNDER